MRLLLYLVTCLVLVSAQQTVKHCSGDSCETWRTPVPNMGAALVGYNPMVGNRFEGTDPGFRSAIFEPTEVSDNGQVLSAHPSIIFKDDINCKINSGTKVIRNYLQYRKEKSGSFSFSEQSQESFSVNVPILSLLTNFEHKQSESRSTSKSRQYKNEVDFFKDTKGEIYINEARCEVFKISVDAFEEPKFTPGFVSSMRALHKAAANPTSRRSKRTLKKFINNFGTHYMSEAWLGATLTTETRIAGSSRSAAQRRERRDCVARAYSEGTNTGGSVREVDVSLSVPVKGAEVGASTTVGGWGAGSGDQYRRAASQCGGSQNANSFFDSRNFQRSTTRSVGSLPLTDTDEWARNTKESPSVIRFNLKSLSTLILDWAEGVKVDDENPDAGNLDAERIYEYLEEATRNYCETALGEPCPTVKGCAYNNLCPFHKQCVNDESTESGFVCIGSLTVSADLVLQSTGAVAEYWGDSLGLYRQAAGRHNGKVYYQQLDGVNEGEYLYWSKWNNWRVGPELDGLAGLRNNQDTDLPPTQGWQYFKSGVLTDVDPSFSLSSWSRSSSLLPSVVTVVSASSDVAGTYEFYDNRFSAGRPVYKRRRGEGGDRFLMMVQGKVSWAIRTELGGGTLLARSGRGTLSPTQPEAGPSIRFNWVYWQIKQGGEWVEDNTFRVN